MPMPTCPLREQRATIVKVMNVPPPKHAGGFPVAMQEARHALGIRNHKSSLRPILRDGRFAASSG
jgi:hypothetical protein